ncbi:hypothetical protein [Cesiribacter andamanensis]|uniref:Lipoprotein n=1 Tax=Cesiribacter andamanensis AMV16 TaxID=1279009 RepID=M7NRB3_9BACT|nr:hypothetical protein [Cesiribacter andamanensis]EMR04245.1 hypothetical protein ADICEAN_00653 [Cesiribacter andamanensis AMV16]
MKNILLLFILSASSCLFSCESGPFGSRCNSDDYRLYERPLLFEILSNQDGRNLLHYSSKYHYDFTILNDQGEEVRNFLSQAGRAQFEPLRAKDYDLSNINIRQYYLYFGNDNIDTLRMEFYLKEGKCDFHEYRDLQIFYNKELYVTYSGEKIPYLTFYTTIPK